MTVKEVARRLRLNTVTVLRLIHDGRLKATQRKWGRRFDITEEAFDALIEEARIKPKSAAR